MGWGILASAHCRQSGVVSVVSAGLRILHGDPEITTVAVTPDPESPTSLLLHTLSLGPFLLGMIVYHPFHDNKEKEKY